MFGKIRDRGRRHLQHLDCFRQMLTTNISRHLKCIKRGGKKKNISKEISLRVKPDFMNNPSNLRLVFVTASPVLTNEVKKFYNDMKMHLIDQIIKHRERKRREKEEEGGEGGRRKEGRKRRGEEKGEE